MDESRGVTDMFGSSWQPVGRIWPWIVAVLGVLIVVTGAVLFTP
ncbi:hypothetical protein [Mycolicibacterium sp. P9-64]|nr:hypothetical protein [Mycolicibacterium sp. P9-64]